jgi:hypothetical protein
MQDRRIRIAAGVVLALAGLWAAGWHLVADKIQSRLGAWIEARRAEGLVAEHAGVRISGFPTAWVLTVSEPALAGAGAAAWAWQGEALEARFSPWTLRDVAVRFPGEHRVSAGGGAALGGLWRVRAAKPDGRILLNASGRLERLEIDFAEAEVTRMPDSAPVQINKLVGVANVHRVPAADHRNETFTLTLGLDGVSPVTPPVAALGSVIETVRLDLTFKGQLPPGRLGPSLAEWRDDGGTVEINHVGVKWGPVNADGSGTLTLDGQNRPLGAFTARWRGYARRSMPCRSPASCGRGKRRGPRSCSAPSPASSRMATARSRSR